MQHFLRKKLETARAHYITLAFKPSLLGFILNPFFLLRSNLYRSFKQLAPQLTGTIIDLGCGSKPYKQLFNVDKYIGVDMLITGHDHSSSKIDIYYDGTKLPFADASIDGIFCSEVFEHIFNLDAVLKELHRVLKPGGKMLVSVPFMWEEHEQPYDYARYTSFGLQHLLASHGFESKIEVKSGTGLYALLQHLISLIFNKIDKLPKIIRLALTPLCIVPISLLGVFYQRFQNKEHNYYLNNIVLLHKTSTV